MIRQITEEDSKNVVSLAVESGLFPAEEVEIVDNMLAGYFAGNAGDGHVCVIQEEGLDPIGVAYYAPATATDGTWYLTMIGIRREHQRGGYGTVLLRHVEDALRKGGHRVLLVETSALPAFEGARAFYLGCGYAEEARIRDFWAAGDDMVVFRKSLQTP